jgi:hypothetical protein
MSTDIKGFYDYTEEELRGGITSGTYHLKVTDAEADHWDDGRPRLNIRTEVASGPSAGSYGPRHTWSLGEYSGVTGDGRAFAITAEDNHKRLIKNVKCVLNGRVPVVTNPTSWDNAMLDEIAQQLVGENFIGTVSDGKNGYQKIDRFYAMSSPPTGFKVKSTEANSFSV